MKTHRKKTKVESSESESDSSDSSSSGETSSDEPRKKVSSRKTKDIKESNTYLKEFRKPDKSESYTKNMETKRRAHGQDSHRYKTQYDKESHSSKDARNRDRKERHSDYAPKSIEVMSRKEKHRDRAYEKPRYDNYTDRRDSRNDAERGDDNRNKRYRRSEQHSGNYNRNNYEQDNSRERHRRAEQPYHNQRYNRDRGPKEYEDRNSKDYDDYRGGNKYSRNKHDRSRSRSIDHTNAKWGKDNNDNSKKDKGKPVEKEKPNFGLSGKLTEERNTFKGIIIKYSEPPEARKPKRRWRLYPFKGEKALQTLYIHRESAYLIGRERKVVDLPVDHPSCSKQHAALQYRLVPFTREDGSAGKRVRPYLIDLDSANGTLINNKKIEPRKYIELLERDVIKFGFSSREYVLLHENSKDEIQDDDVKQEEEEPDVKNEVKVET